MATSTPPPCSARLSIASVSSATPWHRQCLQGLGSIAAARGDVHLTAKLFGASEAMFARPGAVPWRADRREYEHDMAAVIESLGEEEAARFVEKGRALSAQEATALDRGDQTN